MDRKALAREYKETPRPMGVYRVRNTSSGKWLIGSTRNLPGMLNRLRFELDFGSNRNAALQADWNEAGPDAFVIEALDTLEHVDEPGYDPGDDLAVLEQMWRERLNESEGPGY